MTVQELIELLMEYSPEAEVKIIGTQYGELVAETLIEKWITADEEAGTVTFG